MSATWSMWRRFAVRHGLRVATLIAALAMVVPLVAWAPAPKWFVAVSPFAAMGSALTMVVAADRATPPLVVVVLLPAVPLALLALAGRRLFCRWLCPMGLLLDVAGHAGRVNRVLIPIAVGNSASRPVCPSGKHSRNGLGASLVSVGNRIRRPPRLARAILLVTWCGALLGWPVFLWLDPLALFSALFGHGSRHAMAIVPGVIIGLSIAAPKIWCMNLCPLGATQDMVFETGRLARRARRSTRGDVETEGDGDVETPRHSNRRVWAENVVAAGVLFGLAHVVGRRATAGAVEPRLRPPGARPDPDVWRLCLRCGNCMAVCPTAIIRPDAEPPVLSALGSPIVRLDVTGGHCLPTCAACTQVCPSTALLPLSLAAKQEWPIGLAVVDAELCVLSYGRECAICSRECPRDAVSFRSPDGGYTLLVEIDRERCNGCGACVGPCPGENSWELEADPTVALRKALRVEARPDRRDARGDGG